MAEAQASLEQLRDLHMKLAIEFELEANTTDEGDLVPLLFDKREEAFEGALYFQSLIDRGLTEVPQLLRNERLVV
jgi:hypothetical protein